MQSDGFNSALSPVAYGDIVLSINTQYNKYIQAKIKKVLQGEWGRVQHFAHEITKMQFLENKYAM